jgi:hypothetical protein
LKCSARAVGTINSLTLTKPEHNHGPVELSDQKLRLKKDKSYFKTETYFVEEVQE